MELSEDLSVNITNWCQAPCEFFTWCLTPILFFKIKKREQNEQNVFKVI